MHKLWNFIQYEGKHIHMEYVMTCRSPPFFEPSSWRWLMTVYV